MNRMKNVFGKIPPFFLNVYKLPENIVAFLSGILVSASINIFTSMLPESAEKLPSTLLLSASLMLLSSFFMMAWATIVKPCQQKNDEDAPNEKNWPQRLKENSSDKKIIIVSLLSVFCFAGSIVLLFW